MCKEMNVFYIIRKVIRLPYRDIACCKLPYSKYTHYMEASRKLGNTSTGKYATGIYLLTNGFTKSQHGIEIIDVDEIVCDYFDEPIQHEVPMYKWSPWKKLIYDGENHNRISS